MSAQQPETEANLVLDLWGDDDLDTRQTQIMPLQEDTVQQRNSDQSTNDSPLPVPLQQLHQIVTTIARTVVEELADNMDSEFAEKLRLNNIEVLRQAANQHDSVIKSMELAEVKQNLFTLSANLLTLRKAVTRMQEIANSDKAKSFTQTEDNAPAPATTKRKNPFPDQQASVNLANTLPQCSKVSSHPQTKVIRYRITWTDNQPQGVHIPLASSQPPPQLPPTGQALLPRHRAPGTATINQANIQPGSSSIQVPIQGPSNPPTTC